jgi:phage gpG-like protein
VGRQAVEVIGISELNAALTEMFAAVSTATRTATAQASHLLEREIKTTLATSSHRRGTPTPSSPGEPPSLITGTLRRSVTVLGPVPLGLGRWSAEIGPTAVYARVQELGGPTGRGGATVLPARPFVQPSYERLAATGALTNLYHTAWRTAIAHH